MRTGAAHAVFLVTFRVIVPNTINRERPVFIESIYREIYHVIMYTPKRTTHSICQRTSRTKIMETEREMNFVVVFWALWSNKHISI